MTQILYYDLWFVVQHSKVRQAESIENYLASPTFQKFIIMHD